MDSVEEYIKAHDLQSRDAADIIEEFSDEIYQMRGRCIDIGCGPGTLSKHLILRKLHPESVLIGADISQQMIESAKKRFADEERMDFIELDIEATELPRSVLGCYDNALSFYCLHWIQDQRRAYENIYKLLRPGGKVIVTFLTYNYIFKAYLKISEDPVYQPYMKDVQKFVPPTLTNANVRAEMKKMLKETGFEVLHCSNREKTFTYEDMQVLKDHVSAVNPFLHRMPENLREEFLNDLLQDIGSHNIRFLNQSNNNKEEDSVLDKYKVLVAYFRKPLYSQI